MKRVTQRARHPAVYGIVFLLAMVLPIIGLLWGSLRFVFWYWTTAGTHPAQWEIAFFGGAVWAALSAIYLNRLLRSRAIWWYAYYEAWLETLQYPKQPEHTGGDGA